MAEFIAIPTLHIDEDGLWQTHGSLIYKSDLVEQHIVVPEDFVTDLASIPRWVPEFLIQRNGRHRKAAIVHDYLCRFPGFHRPTADKIFLEAMAVSGEARWRRWAMYLAVSALTRWLQLRGRA